MATSWYDREATCMESQKIQMLNLKPNNKTLIKIMMTKFSWDYKPR